MKLKKFFAGVLAAAMMLTVGATSAFAAKYTVENGAMLKPDNDGHAYLTLTKTVEVTKGTAPDDMTFKFEVKDSTGKLLAEPSVEFKASEDGAGTAPNKVYSSGTYNRTFNQH